MTSENINGNDNIRTEDDSKYNLSQRLRRIEFTFLLFIGLNIVCFMHNTFSHHFLNHNPSSIHSSCDIPKVKEAVYFSVREEIKDYIVQIMEEKAFLSEITNKNGIDLVPQIEPDIDEQKQPTESIEGQESSRVKVDMEQELGTTTFRRNRKIRNDKKDSQNVISRSSDRNDHQTLVFSNNYGRCSELPIESSNISFHNFINEEGVHKILGMLRDLSFLNSLSSPHFTAQHKATCWILFGDETTSDWVTRTDFDKNIIIQRYVLAVLYFARNENTKILPTLFMKKNICDDEKLRCNSNGYITAIIWDGSENSSPDVMGGAIPSELSHLHHLEFFSAKDAQLIGTIPSELGKLDKLKVLNLSKNNISGFIPSHIGDLFNLRVLSLDSNYLDGTIPSEIEKCKKLTKLNLSQNNLEGPIASTLIDLPELEYLYLHDNSLTSTIPRIVHKLQNIKVLQLDGNKLEGRIPSEIGYIFALEELWLGSNRLTGPLPSSIGLLKGLQIMNLDENALSGTINLAEFSNLQNLRVFNVGNNRFEGEFPKVLTSCSKLKEINISNNFLSGTLPNDSFYSGIVEKIDLSNNSFSGTIPSGIGNLQDLKVLGLDGNELTLSFSQRIFIALFPTKMSIRTRGLKNVKHATTINNSFISKIPYEFLTLKKLIPITDFKDEQKKKKSMLYSSKPSYASPWYHNNTNCTTCNSTSDEIDGHKMWKIPIWVIAVIIAIFSPLLISSIMYGILRAKEIGYFPFFIDDRDPLSIYRTDSIYCFVFSKNRTARVIHFITATIQFLLFLVYLQASDFHDECQGIDGDCDNESKVDTYGWVLFIIITFSFLGSDFVMSLLQIRKGLILNDIQLLFSGHVLLFLTLLDLFTSALYNAATAQTNPDLIVNAVILIFINQLDEKLMNVIKRMVPHWTTKRRHDIKTNMMSKIDENNPRLIHHRRFSSLSFDESE